MRIVPVALVLLAAVFLLAGCAGNQQSQQAATGQQPPAGSNQKPANLSQQPATSQPPAAQLPATIPPPAPNSSSAPTPAPAPSTAAVEISGFAFSPSELTVAKGTTVTWTNKDSVVHTVTSGSFGSGMIQNGGSYSYTFNDSGTYVYHCIIHPSMRGSITVTG